MLGVLAICGSNSHAAEPIKLRPGFTKLITFDRPVTTVSIGNPAVADTTPQSDRAVLLTGKAVGSTNVIALDDAQKIVFDATVIVGSQSAGKVLIYSKPKQLHQYWAYHCTPVCERVDDPIQNIDRTAPYSRTDERAPPPPPAEDPQGVQ